MVNEVEEGETVNINMLRSLNNTERQVDKTVTTGMQNVNFHLTCLNSKGTLFRCKVIDIFILIS